MHGVLEGAAGATRPHRRRPPAYCPRRRTQACHFVSGQAGPRPQACLHLICKYEWKQHWNVVWLQRGLTDDTQQHIALAGGLACPCVHRQFHRLVVVSAFLIYNPSVCSTHAVFFLSALSAQYKSLLHALRPLSAARIRVHVVGATVV